MKLILQITHKVESWNRKPYRATLSVAYNGREVTEYCWSGRFKTMELAEAALERVADEWQITLTPAETVFKKERKI